ncbi:hypothetical protein F5B17DRAFT_410826 [Nemania serpens]|nr:hypothetical protein F5B17DRAFT_410826 [Nemania serpens]
MAFRYRFRATAVIMFWCIIFVLFCTASIHPFQHGGFASTIIEGPLEKYLLERILEVSLRLPTYVSRIPLIT